MTSPRTPTDDKDSAETEHIRALGIERGGGFRRDLHSHPVEVRFQGSSGGLVGSSGADAAEGSDLAATSGTVTFAANSAAGATESITITATDDALSETAESFTVTLGTITSTLSSQLSLKNGASSAPRRR